MVIRCPADRIYHFVLRLHFKYLIYGQREGIVEHPRQQLLQHRRRFFNARVSINLNQPRIALLINHEIVAKYLKAVASLMLIYLFSNTKCGYFDDFLYFGDKLPEISAPTFHELPQMLKRKLVAQLVLPIVLIVLLHGVIGKMDVEIGQLLGI